MAYPKNILFTFYMVEHYLDIKRKHNFNSKDTMLQIVTTPRHNCQKFVSKRFDSRLSSEEKFESGVFFGKKSDSKLPLSLTIFVRYFSLNISSGSLLAFLFAPLVRF